MTDPQILEKAIQKAIDGGYPWNNELTLEAVAEYYIDGDSYYQLSTLIFDHDFAKALWGDHISMRSTKYVPDEKYLHCTYVSIPYWQYHLQQMVIVENRIKYLGENI